MDGNTPIDCLEPQFTQREAAELSGADMASINNWIQRGDFELKEVRDRRLQGRRFFSISDIAALRAFNHCVKALELRPSAAAFAANVVREFYSDPELRDPGKTATGKHYRVWHMLARMTLIETGDGDWIERPLWQDPESGVFYNDNPVMFAATMPFMFTDFASIIIPTSTIVNRTFLKCCDALSIDRGLEPMNTDVEDFAPKK